MWIRQRRELFHKYEDAIEDANEESIVDAFAEEISYAENLQEGELK